MQCKHVPLALPAHILIASTAASYILLDQIKAKWQKGSFLYRADTAVPHEMLHAHLRKSLFGAENFKASASNNSASGEEPSLQLDPVEVVKRPPVTSLVIKRVSLLLSHFWKYTQVAAHVYWESFL